MKSEGGHDYSGGPNKMYNLGSQSDSRLTPKPSRGKLSMATYMSTYKRPGTAAEEFERRTTFGSPRSLRTFSDFIGGDESIEMVDRSEIPADLGDDEDDDAWEGLENVRACCDGKHDGESSLPSSPYLLDVADFLCSFSVGSLSRRGGHHQFVSRSYPSRLSRRSV
jgi:hypothetical protein